MQREQSERLLGCVPLAVSCFLLGLLSGGCAVFGTTHITSEPEGALILIDGAETGRTPLTVTLPDKPDASSTWVFKATLPGYREEVRVFKEIYPQFVEAVVPQRIHFVLQHNDTSNADADGRVRTVVCDLRIIQVVDGSIVATASGHAALADLEQLVAELAEELKNKVYIKGKSIAVVTLRNRSRTSEGRVIADEIADNLSGALVDTGWFLVSERIDLRSVFDEKDLESAGIVGDANLKQKLAGVDHVVIGGVTIR